MKISDIPAGFVWTKIQADAGQRIDLILRRKELERQSGSTFWWGIGQSPKGERIKHLGPRPAVFFSLMRSAAHKRDSHPEDVLLWEQYIIAATRKAVPLPPHAVVISRAHDKNGSLKSSYAALVCENSDGIPRSAGGALDIGMLRNLGGRPIGSSQITAVAEPIPEGKGASVPYPITARATLVAPFAVRLAAPRLLSPLERHLLDEVSREGKTVEDWMAVAQQLRRVRPQSHAKLAVPNRSAASPSLRLGFTSLEAGSGFPALPAGRAYAREASLSQEQGTTKNSVEDKDR
jgi:hypothetical protein